MKRNLINKKVRAFTLIELLAAMVISSLVMSAAYFAYNSLTKSFLDFKKHTNNLTDATALSGILTHDINLAKTIRKNTTNDITLEMGNKKLQYEWKENFVLRSTGISADTFPLAVSDMKINFLDKEQTISGGLVDELKFTTIADGQQLFLSFDKKYASDILVESEMKSNAGY